MNLHTTHITVILDRSGSMQSVRSDVIGGFNTFLDEQKKTPGECTFTLAQFDTNDPYEVLRDFAPLNEVQPLGDEYLPRGGTPLYDAVGRGIIDTGHRLARLPEDQRPGKVIFVIITDGQENSSREFTRDKVFEMTRHQQEKYSWQFVYIGANQDAMAVGATLGVAAANSLTYGAANSGGMMRALAQNTSRFRTGEATDMEWKPEERDAAK